MYASQNQGYTDSIKAFPQLLTPGKSKRSLGLILMRCIFDPYTHSGVLRIDQHFINCMRHHH